jgi:hypothetical protein
MLPGEEDFREFRKLAEEEFPVSKLLDFSQFLSSASCQKRDIADGL